MELISILTVVCIGLFIYAQYFTPSDELDHEGNPVVRNKRRHRQ